MLARYPLPPQYFDRSAIRLLRTWIELPCRLGCRLSVPVTWKAPPMLPTTLFSKVTCSTTHHGQLPPWLRVVNRMAVPDCAWAQLLVNRLCSTSTRRAFFSSNGFFPCHNVAADGVPVVAATTPSSVNVVPLTIQYWFGVLTVLPYT